MSLRLEVERMKPKPQKTSQPHSQTMQLTCAEKHVLLPTYLQRLKLRFLACKESLSNEN